MYTRIITYDLNNADNNDYSDFYNLLDKYSARKITESTYQIETNEKYDIFKEKFLKVTDAGDIVKCIVLCDGRIEIRNVR